MTDATNGRKGATTARTYRPHERPLGVDCCRPRSRPPRSAIGATSSLGLVPANDSLLSAEETKLRAWVRVTRTPAPRRERGELGQGRVRAARQRCLEALYRDGAAPRHLKCWYSIGAHEDFGRILLLSGVNPYQDCPMMGSEGPVVQADSTWCPNALCSAHSGRGGLKPFPASGRCLALPLLALRLGEFMPRSSLQADSRTQISCP
jgi:hypothetical protein